MFFKSLESDDVLFLIPGKMPQPTPSTLSMNWCEIFGRMVETARLHHNGKIRAVTSSRGPGNELFITTAGANGVKQWHSFGSGDYILGHRYPPTSAFSQNVRFLAVNSGASVYVVDVVTGHYLGGLTFSVLHGPVISKQ